MTIEQTIEIPDSRRITFEAPKEVPAGRARVIIQFPVREDTQADVTIPPEAKGQMNNEAFRQILRNACGAWKDNPWTNHLEDVNAMRDEWEQRN